MPLENAAAIFGGSFNPVHRSHIQLIQEIQKLFHFNPLWVVPSQLHKPKEKDAIFPHHRLEMVKLAFQNIANVNISSYELDSKKPCYSIDTISYFKKQLNDRDLFFLIGQDAFIDFPNWYRFPEILTACSFIVVTRQGYEHLIDQNIEKFVYDKLFFEQKAAAPFSRSFSTNKNTALYFIEIQLPEISSTLIRNRLKQHQSIEDLVPPSVEDYLKSHPLNAILKTKSHDE